MIPMVDIFFTRWRMVSQRLFCVFLNANDSDIKWYMRVFTNTKCVGSGRWGQIFLCLTFCTPAFPPHDCSLIKYKIDNIGRKVRSVSAILSVMSRTMVWSGGSVEGEVSVWELFKPYYRLADGNEGYNSRLMSAVHNEGWNPLQSFQSPHNIRYLFT